MRYTKKNPFLTCNFLNLVILDFEFDVITI